MAAGIACVTANMEVLGVTGLSLVKKAQAWRRACGSECMCEGCACGCALAFELSSKRVHTAWMPHRALHMPLYRTQLVEYTIANTTHGLISACIAGVTPWHLLYMYVPDAGVTIDTSDTWALYWLYVMFFAVGL
jgi:hypothetical protein